MTWRLTFLLVATLIPTILPAQVTIGPEGPIAAKKEKQPDRDQPKVYELTITPAPEPSPALKYRFDVPLADQKPGNSVPFYYRALIKFNQEYLRKQHGDFDELYESVQDVPLSEFPIDKAREVLATYGIIFEQLERAHNRTETEWDWHMEELRGTEWMSFWLPEIQDSRVLGRLLYVKGRLELAEGRFEDAEQTLRIGYHLARAVSEPPTIIDDLVGVAIADMMNDLVIDWISVRGSPNVYWAIAVLPDPFIDFRYSVERELGVAHRFAPWLENVRTEDAPPAVWRDRFVELVQTLVDFEGELGFLATGPGGDPPSEDVTALFVTLISLQHYPIAKQALLERGYSAEQVKSMPVGQVLAIQQRYIDRVIADERMKAMLVAPTHAVRVQESMEQTLKEEKLLGPPLTGSPEPFPIMAMFSPASGYSTVTSLRLRTRLAALRTVEAIRMHAAKTGALPKSLAEIEIVPVPDSPRTGQPFEYSLNDDTAVLNVVVETRYQVPNWRFELTLDSADKK